MHDSPRAVVPDIQTNKSSITNFLSLTDAVNINEKEKKKSPETLSKKHIQPPPSPSTSYKNGYFPGYLKDISFGLLSESVLNQPTTASFSDSGVDDK